MHPALKIIIGLILIIIGLGLFVDSVYPILGVLGTFGIDWLKNFIVVLTGVIPIFLIIVGLFVVWLEMDELRAQKELKKEKKKD
jgi:cadmium resistance protein CadD (predicted permease)